MPRRPQLEVIETPKGYKLEVPASLSATGKRQRFFYADQKAAKKHSLAVLKAYHERGTKAGILDPATVSEAMRAEEMLKPFGVSLLVAVRDYVTRYSATGAMKTVGDAWADYQALLVKNGRSEASIADYKRDRKSLPDWFFKLKVGDATAAQIERALDDCTANRGKAWNRKLREVRAVLREATRTEVKPASVKRKDPVILAPAEVAAVMAMAESQGCALPFALLFFAGIRPQGELSRLCWGDIREREIAISSEVSKTDDDRHVPIMPNLRQWLTKCKGHAIQPPDWEKKYQAIRKACGITDQDVARHTFGSSFYRLHTETETIQAMGHTSFKTFERFYKRAVTKQAATAHFAIRPTKKAAKKAAAPKLEAVTTNRKAS